MWNSNSSRLTFQHKENYHEQKEIICSHDYNPQKLVPYLHEADSFTFSQKSARIKKKKKKRM